MPGPAAILKELHRLRRLVQELEIKIDQAPRQLGVQQRKLQNQEDTLAQAKEHIKRLTLEMRDKETSIKATQAQIKKYEKQLDTAANKKEYDTLQLEIAQERAHISKLEDEILAMMSESEEKTAQLPEVQKTAEKAKADYAQYEKDQQERLARFAEEKARALDDIKTAEGTLPADVRAQYDRLITAKGNDALSSVNGRTCTACYTEITTQMFSELKREIFLICKNCGRMLYMEG